MKKTKYSINRPSIDKINIEELSDHLKMILYNKLVKMSQSCIPMNGTPSYKYGLTQMTLQCFNDEDEIQDILIYELSNGIQKYIKKYHIHNTINIEHFLSRKLNLLEDVVYPIKHSKQYTLNGEQYTTKNKIIKIVDNLKIDKILETIFIDN
jgi:hypothetical protein